MPPVTSASYRGSTIGSTRSSGRRNLTAKELPDPQAVDHPAADQRVAAHRHFGLVAERGGKGAAHLVRCLQSRGEPPCTAIERPRLDPAMHLAGKPPALPFRQNRDTDKGVVLHPKAVFDTGR